MKKKEAERVYKSLKNFVQSHNKFKADNEKLKEKKKKLEEEEVNLKSLLYMPPDKAEPENIQTFYKDFEDIKKKIESSISKNDSFIKRAEEFFETFFEEEARNEFGEEGAKRLQKLIQKDEEGFYKDFDENEFYEAVQFEKESLSSTQKEETALKEDFWKDIDIISSEMIELSHELEKIIEKTDTILKRLEELKHQYIQQKNNDIEEKAKKEKEIVEPMTNEEKVEEKRKEKEIISEEKKQESEKKPAMDLVETLEKDIADESISDIDIDLDDMDCDEFYTYGPKL